MKWRRGYSDADDDEDDDDDDVASSDEEEEQGEAGGGAGACLPTFFLSFASLFLVLTFFTGILELAKIFAQPAS